MLLLDLIYFEKRLTIGIILALKMTKPEEVQNHRYNAEILMVPTCVMLILSTFPVFLERLFNSTCTVESIRVIQACLHVGIYLVMLVSICATILASFCLKDLQNTSIIVACIHIMWAALLSTASYQTWRSARQSYLAMIEFHDFLIEYRQTPRTRLLRRHLPEMEAVVEEESKYE